MTLCRRADEPEPRRARRCSGSRSRSSASGATTARRCVTSRTRSASTRRRCTTTSPARRTSSAACSRAGAREARELVEWLAAQPSAPGPPAPDGAALARRVLRREAARDPVHEPEPAECCGRCPRARTSATTWARSRSTSAMRGRTQTLLIQMAFMSIANAVAAADGTGISDEDAIRAARTAAGALLRRGRSLVVPELLVERAAVRTIEGLRRCLRRTRTGSGH